MMECFMLYDPWWPGKWKLFQGNECAVASFAETFPDVIYFMVRVTTEV